MSDNIPDEVMMEILGRLPVRTLLRFRCVCKSWCSLIRSEIFVTFWFNRSTHLNNVNNTHLLLLRHYTESDKKEHFSLHLDDESLTEYPLNLDSRPVVRFYPHLTVLGSCNGLVCVTNDILSMSDCSLYLWNPSIRKFVVLPRPRITCETHGVFNYCRVLGFGFDSATNDYRVVRIVYISGGTEEVDIYSLKEGGWRRISVSGPVPFIDCEPSHAYHNGAIHWVALGPNHNFIVLFNLGTEVFTQMELPTSLSHIQIPLSEIGQHRSLPLAVFQDSLCVFLSDSCNCKASIWMMKEYGVVESWTNLINLDYSREFPLREEFGVVESRSNLFNLDFHRGFAQEVRVIGLRRNGEVLLVKDEEMISVDIKAQTFKNLKIRGCDAAFSVNTYTESLVLIDKANGLQEG